MVRWLLWVNYTQVPLIMALFCIWRWSFWSYPILFFANVMFIKRSYYLCDYHVKEAHFHSIFDATINIWWTWLSHIHSCQSESIKGKVSLMPLLPPVHLLNHWCVWSPLLVSEGLIIGCFNRWSVLIWCLDFWDTKKTWRGKPLHLDDFHCIIVFFLNGDTTELQFNWSVILSRGIILSMILMKYDDQTHQNI